MPPPISSRTCSRWWIRWRRFRRPSEPEPASGGSAEGACSSVWHSCRSSLRQAFETLLESWLLIVPGDLDFVFWEVIPERGCDNRPMPERLEVQRAVAASAGEIFAVLIDPRGHVAIDSSGMLMAASGDAVTKAGDTFVVHMDREALNDYPLGLYDVTVEIVTFEPDREIAWTVHGQFDIGHVYGYRLEPIAQGTLVTSYYDWSAVDQNWKDAAIFPVIPESALRATLGILARTAAPGKPRPALADQ